MPWEEVLGEQNLTGENGCDGVNEDFPQEGISI